MSHFGTTAQGEPVEKIILNAGDLSVSILTLGAIIQDVRLKGVDHSLTIGSDDLADYEGSMCYHGSLIGPIVNRISNARIKIDGMMHELVRNQRGYIHLHSGPDGTQHRVWRIAAQSEQSVTLTCTLPDGANGLPGHRVVTVIYTLTKPAELTMTVTGTSDATTAMNFANHSYWNLDGTPRWDGHKLQINADRYLESNPDFTPTGAILDVAGTPFDLREGRALTSEKDVLDTNFCLSDKRQPLRDVLWLTGTTGVQMCVGTTETGIQVYDNRGPYAGLAIEAQSWPDAPNHRGFPSILLHPDETYAQITRFRFTQSAAAIG